jgi:hypothetical protein
MLTEVKLISGCNFLANIPPPPPMPQSSQKISIPPPPPIPAPIISKPEQLTPKDPSQMNGGSKSQENTKSFEPPPMGCRPEIKIPPNPIAGLRKSPRPQPKDDYWIEEYRQEKGVDAEPVYRSPAPMSPPTEPKYVALQQQQVSSPVREYAPMSPPAQMSPKSPMSPPIPPPMPQSMINQSMRSESPVRNTPPHLTMSPIPSNLPPPINPIKTPVSSPVKEEVQPTYQQQMSQPYQQQMSQPYQQQMSQPYQYEIPTSQMEQRMPNQGYSEPEKARKIIMSTMPQHLREHPHPQQQPQEEV